MNPAFKKIAIAIAFSPHTKAMAGIGNTIATLFNAQLILIHVGKAEDKEKAKQQMNLIVGEAALSPDKVTIVWEEGDPVKKILKICDEHGVDLLIAGALKREKLVKYYIGTIARKIMRKAKCSILMINNPSVDSASFKNIVVNAADSACTEDAISIACQLGNKVQASWVHVVRELKLYGLTMSTAEHNSEEEYDDGRQKLVRDEIEKVEEMLRRIIVEKPKINIKIISGKAGFELSRFTERKHADLLVVSAPPRRLSILDRIFPNDLEYIFSDLPCHLLVVNTMRKETKRG
jgi:nucleotide-binding universal stress UspA family protein